MEKSCNCSLSYQLGLGGNDTCNKDCVKPIVETEFDYNGNCSSECPLECDLVSFDLTKNKEKIVDSDFYDVFKKNLNKSNKFSNFTFESIKEKIIFLHINFGKMSFTKITEVPKKTFTDLIADLGGTIGKIKLTFIL